MAEACSSERGREGGMEGRRSAISRGRPKSDACMHAYTHIHTVYAMQNMTATSSRAASSARRRVKEDAERAPCVCSCLSSLCLKNPSAIQERNFMGCLWCGKDRIVFI